MTDTGGILMANSHVLENDVLRIAVSDAGAELISVFDKEKQAERIWTADPAVWNRHSPVLFPFVGKVKDGKYRYGGKEYAMKTQHGFARDMEFTCLEETPVAVKHCLTATEATKEIYPFDFRLTVEHSIDPEQPRRLTVRWKIENLGDEQMIFAIGGHPGFLCPEGIKKEDCFIVFPDRQELCYISANAAGFALPEKKYTLLTDKGFAAYQPDIPDTWIFEDCQVETVGIATPDRKPFVTMHCAGFPMLAVWANPAGPFICLEPWFGRTDDEGFTGSAEEKKSMQSLPGGSEKDISYSVIFH